MKLISPEVIGLFLLVSEVLLVLRRRSGSGTTQEDGNSIRILWSVIGLSILAGACAMYLFPAGRLPQPQEWAVAGAIIFLLGVIFRWWAIIQLGRFFTVDVAIASDHKLVEMGPYRFIRHPSYTGLLVAFLGFSLTLVNWISVLAIMVPIFFAFVHRMNVEERALVPALGEEYRAYQRRTKRLLPFVY